jgi:hypothetical protein
MRYRARIARAVHRSRLSTATSDSKLRRLIERQVIGDNPRAWAMIQLQGGNTHPLGDEAHVGGQLTKYDF